MHIEQISTRLLSLPLKKPHRTSRDVVVDSVGHVLVQARTNEGHVGTGYTLSIYRQLPALKAATDELKELAIGKDPFAVRSIWKSMMASASWFGPGILYFAISAIDIALWDLLGKVTGKSLSMLLGGWREQVPCYYTGFRRSTPIQGLAEEAADCLRQGFGGVKIKSGGEPTLDKEIERAKTVREALGGDASLMVDPNQAWSPDLAIKMGERLKEHNIAWIEDPVPNEDMDGRSRVAACLDIPIATGEDQFTKTAFLQLIEHKVADIFNVDVQRAGGITGWLDLTAFLEARDRTFAGHHLPEIQCHLMSTTAKGLAIEYVPYSMGLYKEGPKIEGGFIHVPKGPGIGLEIAEEAIERYELT